MKNSISSLTEAELTLNLKNAVTAEKFASFKVIEYLAEVDARRLYAVQAYSSLFEYAVKELGYSESQASERIASMRLFVDMPEVKKMLDSGTLSLTTAAQIQRFFRNEKKFSDAPLSDIEKRSVLDLCQNKSKREVERVLFQVQSDEVTLNTSERIRRVSETHFEVRFLVPERLLEQINEVRNLVGEQALATTFENAVKIYLSSLRKQKTKSEKLSETLPFPAESASNQNENAGPFTVCASRTARKKIEPIESSAKNKCDTTNAAERAPNLQTSGQIFSRYIPVRLKKMLWARSGGQCEFLDPMTRNRCLSRYRIQIDHKIPFAIGGRTEIENLRHLCQGHNLRSALEWFPNKKPRNTNFEFRGQ